MKAPRCPKCHEEMKLTTVRVDREEEGIFTCDECDEVVWADELE